MSPLCSRCVLRPHRPLIVSTSVRSLSLSSLFRWKKKTLKREEDILLQPPVLDGDVAVPASPSKTSVWSDLTPEEETRIRFKSGLPREILCEQRGIPVHGTRFTYLEHYRRDFVRQYFATYGKASGLKPGVCWPSKQELEFRIKWEQTFYPSFKEMVDRKKAEQEKKTKELAKYRTDILNNLKKLPAAKKEFYAKLNEKKQQELDEKAKREKVIQDVREYLGYDVAPGDTRFQEALAKKEQEDLAVKKASKKQERQAKIMAELAAMAEEQIKKAADAIEKSAETESPSPPEPVSGPKDETPAAKGPKDKK